MNKPDPAPQALNDLEASLKRVLLHTGSALIHSNGNAGVQMDSARRDLRKTLPEALSQWYDGLAVLEKQLVCIEMDSRLVRANDLLGDVEGYLAP